MKRSLLRGLLPLAAVLTLAVLEPWLSQTEAPPVPTTYHEPQLVATPAGYALAFTSNRDGKTDVVYARLGTDGRVLGGPERLSDGQGISSGPRVASWGAGGAVGWVRARAAAELVFFRSQGGRRPGPPLRLEAPQLSQLGLVAAPGGQGGVTAVLLRGRGEKGGHLVEWVRISEAGEILDRRILLEGSEAVISPLALAAGADGTVALGLSGVLSDEARAPSTLRVFLVTPEGKISRQVLVDQGHSGDDPEPAALSPSPERGGRGFRLVFDHGGLHAAALGPDGLERPLTGILDDEALTLSLAPGPAGSSSAHALAFADPGDVLRAALLDASGRVSGRTLQVAREASEPSLALRGREYGLAYADTRPGHQAIRFARLTVRSSDLAVVPAALPIR